MTIYSKINAVNTHRSMETVIPKSIELTEEEIAEVYNTEVDHKAGRYTNVRTAIRNTKNKGLVLFATQNGLISEIASSDLISKHEELTQAFVKGFEKKEWIDPLPVTTVSKYIQICLHNDPFRIIAAMDSNEIVRDKIKASIGLIFSGELSKLIDGEDNKVLEIICNENSNIISRTFGPHGMKSISNTLKTNIDKLNEMVQNDEKRYGEASHIPFEITATIAGFIID